MSRIYLSPPDVGPAERAALGRAFDGGWIAPLGPEIDAFETELAAATGRAHGVALTSGTAALHLALINAGVGPGDRVVVQDLTFAATANAVMYVDAEPTFVDSEPSSWNMDPDRLAETLDAGAVAGRPFAAVITVDIYGQCADYDRILPICEQYGVTLIEDAAEALGATYREVPAGGFGTAATLSFNGNKIITTSGGGALVTDDAGWAEQSRFRATQARDPAPHYQHSKLGFNYRLSNLLAAMGRAQLEDLARRVDIRRATNRFYRKALADIPGVSFMPEPPECRSTFWLTALTIDPAEAGAGRDDVRIHLESRDIEARPLWKPMHLQPLFADRVMVGGEVVERLFANGLCIPSGSTLTEAEREWVAAEIRRALPAS